MKFWKKAAPDTAINGANAPTSYNAQDAQNELTNPFDTSSPEYSVTAEAHEQADPELAAGALTLKKRFSLASLQSSSATLIAFQAGSFGLRAALVQQSKDRVIAKAVVHSRTVDFTRAIADVMEQLRETQKRLPKRAILLTPSVVSTVVELPVSPLRPRSDEQMQELIRWELEGAITQQNKHWMIGSMLIERGYLNSEQRDEVLTELQFRQTQGGSQSLLRFGDLSVQLGFITRDQLDECFALQGKLVAVDDDLVYGWQSAETQRGGLSDEVLLSQEEDSDSSHAWLVSGMSKIVRRRWVGAFNLNHIHLEAFYPTLGSAFSCLNLENETSHQWLFEIHQEQLALISGTHKVISHFQSAERQPGNTPSLNECIDLIGMLPANITQLFLNTPGQVDLSELLQPLADTLQVEIQQVITPEVNGKKHENSDKGTLPGLIGAASHYLQQIPASRISSIEAREQKEPTWKKFLKPRNLALSGAAITLVTMFSFLGWAYINTQTQTLRLNELNAKYERDLKVKQQLQALYSESIQIRTDLTNIKQETLVSQALLNRLELDRSHRAVNLAPLLKAITLGLTPDIALISINKKQDKVTLIAEVSTPALGQEYVETLTRLVRPVHYQVSNSMLLKTDTTRQHFQIELDFKPGLANRLLSSIETSYTATNTTPEKTSKTVAYTKATTQESEHVFVKK
ncbi:MAG: hypothetical protein ACKVJE_22615 [Pseudomonadales bacterium]